MSPRKLARVHQFAHSEQDQLIEQSDDIAAWLMDRANDSPVVVSCEVGQAIDNVECVVGVQTWKIMSIGSREGVF